jgi:hypothetical protein
LALQKQLVPLEIYEGLDTKYDDKQQPPGYLRAAQNLVYETVKKFKKRNGYDLLDLVRLNGTTISDAIMLSKYQNELLVMSPSLLYSYSRSLGRFVEKGPLYSINTLEASVSKTANNVEQCDSLVIDKFKVFTWQDGTTVRYSVQDISDNSFLVANKSAATGERPVISAIGNTAFIVYGNGANIEYKQFNILDPATLGAAVVVASDRNLVDGYISCYFAPNAIAVAYHSDNAGDDLSLFKINSNGTPSSTITVSGETPTRALNVYVDSLDRIIITFSNGTDFKVAIYPLNLNSSLLAPTVVESIADVVNCCSIELNAGVYRLHYEVEQPGPLTNYVKQAQVTLAGTVSAMSVYNRSVGLAGNSFDYNGAVYVPVVLESELQSSYFLLDEKAAIVTKWQNQSASGVVESGVLPHVFPLGPTSIMLSGLYKVRIDADNGTFFTNSGVAQVEVDFAPEQPFSNAELAGSLHIAAGVLKQYDGATVVEHGFHAYPEYLELDSTATTGGNISNGNYAYKAIYKWIDNTGREHRSAPTPLDFEVVLSGGGVTQTAVVTVPTLRLTEKVDATIELYRTENNGTQYYKVTSDASPILNNKTVDTINITDTLSDASLISREALYTTGGVLENLPAPSCNQVEVYNGERIVVASGTRTTFSKQVDEEGPVEFSDINYRDVSPAGGPITALRAMAEKMIIFQTEAAHYVAGEGMNNLGQQDNLTKPEIIATDIGSVGSATALLNTGILFKSLKGLYLLGPGLGLQYIGDRVEAYNSQTITSIQIVGELNQVRCLLSEERALVFNYNLQRWATFENHGGKSSIAIAQDYYYLREDGSLYRENRDSFSDASSPITLKMETGWLSFAELQGYQRAYNLFILGTYKSPHKLRVKIAYDFIDAYVDEVIIDSADFIDAAAYGSDQFYGESSPYGGNGALYEVRVDLDQQKCTAIKMSIEDVQASAGEALSISGLTLRAGVKEGGSKLGSSNKFGTE